MRAVVWTDVIQFCMVATGLIAIVSAAYSGIGAGWSEIWHRAHALGHTQMFDFSFSFTHEFAFWAILIGGVFPILNGHATDQVMVQRYMSARSIEESQKALKLQALIFIPLSILLQAVGLLLTVYYQAHRREAAGIHVQDTVVPYFALHTMRSGLAGLIIASIFAAAMSAISGGINALTNATLEDFYRRFFRPQAREAESVRVARVTSVLWGLVTTVIALFAGRIGSVAYSYDKVNSLIGGVILGLFLLGMLTKRTSGSAALIGAAFATAVLIFVAYGTPIVWLWYGVIGCGTTFAVAYLATRMLRTPVRSAVAVHTLNPETEARRSL